MSRTNRAGPFPCQDLDDLITAFSFALDHPEHALEVERVLDGVSRLCAIRPRDFDRRLGRLARRAQRLCSADAEDFMRRDLARLTLAWAHGQVPTLPPRVVGAPDLSTFARCRLESLGARVASGLALPLLSAPTDGKGSIAAETLVERLSAWQGQDLDVYDFVLALARLAPQGRDAALALAGTLEGTGADALRHALGASLPLPAAASEDALWVAADDARRQASRQPASATSLLSQLHEGSRTLPIRAMRSYPALPENVPTSHLAVLRYCDIEAGPFEPPLSFVRWLATIRPWDLEPFFAMGARSMAWSHPSHRGYLERLADADVALGPMARLVLVLALGSSGALERRLAVEALLAAHADGRLDVGALGTEMAWYQEAGLVVVSRWRRQLAAIASHSESAAQVVAALLPLAHGKRPSPPAGRAHGMEASLDQYATAKSTCSLASSPE